MTVYGFVPAQEVRARAEAASARAMALGPLLAESHFASALATLYYTEAWEAAEPHFRKTIELQPQAATAQVYFSVFLAARHRFDEAAVCARKATMLDPLSPFVHAGGAVVGYLARRYEDATRSGDRALELHPDFALGLWTIGLSQSRLGHHDRVISLLEKAMSVSGRAPFFVGLLGLGLAVAGRTHDAHTLLDELRTRRAREYVVPVAPLAIHVGLGHRDDIYAALGECVDQGYNGMGVEAFLGPYLDDLAGDPRFAELFRRLHLAPRTTRP